MRERLSEWLAVALMMPAVISVVTGVLVVCSQVLHWVKFAEWPTSTLRTGLSWLRSGPVADPSTGFLGIDQVLKWCLDVPPLAVWLIIVFPVAWVMFWDRDTR